MKKIIIFLVLSLIFNSFVSAQDITIKANDYNDLVIWMQTYLIYIREPITQDYWQTPLETYIKGGGDCMEENTYIITKDGRKKIKDIKIGDLVLSYNYIKKRFEYKPITKKWDKGNLNGFKVLLSNGHFFIATGNHRFFVRSSQSNKKLFKVETLNEINLTRIYSRQIHSVAFLPEGKKHINKYKAYLYGIYIAEGFSDGKHVRIAQDKKSIREKIETALNNLNVPYTKSKRIKHQYYTLLESSFKQECKQLGTNSFNMIIPEEVLEWDNQSIKYLIEGLLDGDGTDRKNITNDNSLWEFSTFSDNVAYMFNIIVRRVYGNCWFDYVKKHGGLGNRPIYRIRYNPQSFFNQPIFRGISTVSIRKKTIVRNKHYYDIEVKDNHNFILADSGVISHTCEDMALFAHHCLGQMGYLSNVYALKWKNNNIGHAVCVFRDRDGKYKLIDLTYMSSIGLNSPSDIIRHFYPEIESIFLVSPIRYGNAYTQKIHQECKKLIWTQGMD